jgi:nucleoside-diphosphate-sugar epimerase
VAAPVLITGATGLLGRHVVAGWSDPDLEPVPTTSAVDLLVPGAAHDLVRHVRPAVVLHLAWTASGTPAYRDDVRNAAWVDTTVELAESAADVGAWFIGTGTAVDRADDPSDAYSAAKVAVRARLATAIDAGDCTWLLPFYVVDPEVGRPALVAEALAARDAGRPLVLRTPESRHDFVHAADVAEAVRIAVHHRLGGEVPIGTGVARPVRDLVDALGAPWAPASSATRHDRGPAQHHEAANPQRLLDHGWAPTHTKEMFHGA